MVTTWPEQRGKGEGEAETLTRDMGGRAGLNMGGIERCRPTWWMSGEEEDEEGREWETESERGPHYVAATGAWVTEINN